MRLVLFAAALVILCGLGLGCAGLDEGTELQDENVTGDVSPNDAAQEATLLAARADSLLTLGKRSRAIDLLERAVDLDPTFIDARMTLGEAWIYEENYPEAIETFRGVVSLDPDSDRALFNLGFALWQAEQLDEAKFHLEAALAQSSDSALTAKIKRSLRKIERD